MSNYELPRLIREDDETSSFNCGKADLDSYLQERAVGNHLGGASRCYVTCRDGRVAGYYALAAGAITRSQVAGRVRRNMPDPVPVILLSRLAVDGKERGKGLGRSLLRDAIERTVGVAESIGVRALLVHALDEEARDFYTHFDFEPSVTDPLHLLLLIKDAQAAL